MQQFLDFLAAGLSQLSVWQVVLVTLILTHITIVAVTLYLHRSQAHRGLELHPVVSHFFRFWLWLTTGMVTREWVAIHRKHHAKCEKEGDPHSPIIYGIDRVLWRGAELYRDEALNEETIARFSHGTPSDWVEKNIYSKHPSWGILIMLGLDVLLFGAMGLCVWAVQMAWIPFWAAGVINGLGHYVGYRNFASPDTSTNLVPIGILIGGEELHNNHHAYGTSAKFSSKWYEFDIGWMYISLLKFFRLAQVKKLAPTLKLTQTAQEDVTVDTLQGIITHRYEIMRRYALLLKQTALQEMSKLKHQPASREEHESLAFVSQHITQSEQGLNEAQKEKLANSLRMNVALHQLDMMREQLFRVWGSSTATTEQLLADLRHWLEQAQQSGVKSLEEFAHRLRRYAV